MSKNISQRFASMTPLLWILSAPFSTPALAQSAAFLESPTQGSFESGVGLIRGWVCQASRVEVSIDDGPLLPTAYGTERNDTQTACGDINNGFGLTLNWNLLGDGVHNLRALADGVQFGSVNFTVTTLGSEFLTGLTNAYVLNNFPIVGASPIVRWSEPHQNFVFTSQVSIPAVSNPPSNPRAFLESPTQGSYESGVGLIRGWVCEAGRVEVRIDGRSALQTAYGTSRNDTAAVCSDSNNGFGLTVNWNSVGAGVVHNLRAFADGVEFANVNFAVTTLGGEYLTGLSSEQTLFDFPSAGKTVTLSWSEPHQNFIIAKTGATAYQVTATAGSGGAISPSSQTVNAGAVASFTVTANSGFRIVSVTGCSGTLSGSTYTTGSINAACTVSASFSNQATSTITLPVGSSGSVTGSSAADIFTFNVVEALASAPNTQLTVTDFNPAADSLRLTLPAGKGVGFTRLSQLNGLDLGGNNVIAVQINPFTGATLISFGSDLDGNLATVTLNGATDLANIVISVQ